MLETPDELKALQRLIDASHARASDHLRSIVAGERVLTARDIAALLTGMKVITVATVTARGEPRVSALDGHFLHGAWTFGTAGGSAKARHLERRPAVSVAHVDGEEFAVFSHGTARQLRDGDPDWAETIAHWTAHYGTSPLGFGEDVRMYRLEPSWLVGYAADRGELLAKRGIPAQG